MEYFEDEIKQERDVTPNNEMIEDNIQVEELVNQNELVSQNEIKPKPETIEIKHKEKVLPYVIPQENKYWHFKFNDANQNQLTLFLQNIPGYQFTVSYGEAQNSPDITLSDETDIMGKIHFLLSDRRDKGNKSRYYIKLYFYDFKNQQIFDTVKNNLINYFENFKPMRKMSKSTNKKINNKNNTFKKRRNNNRNKSIRRK